MAKKTPQVTEDTPSTPATPNPAQGLTLEDLIKALGSGLERAIQNTKPETKKTITNRKPGDPWTPKDGTKKLKLKRNAFQHGIRLDPDFMNNETISLWNQLKPGSFCEGWVKVYKRKDGGIDIDYPIKTASQRMQLLTKYRIFSTDDLLRLCIEEAKKPKVDIPQDDDL